MWEEIFQMAAETGVWAVLFVWLFFRQQKDSKVREEKYQQTIDTLVERLEMIAEIKTCVEGLRSTMTGKEVLTEEKDVK